MSLITLETDLTAVEVAKTQIQKLRAVMGDQLERRLKACSEDVDDEGNVMFIEPPDMKWYMKEYRETLKVEAQLEQVKKRDEAKTAVDLISIMAQQTKLTRDEREKYRREVIDVEAHESSDDESST